MNLPPFLTMWPYDEIVLTGHRIGLYHVIFHHKEGMSAEQLHEHYPSLPVELINQVLSFYRENQAEVDAYVAHEQEEIDRLEATTPRRMNLEELRRRYESKKRAEAIGDGSPSTSRPREEKRPMQLPAFLTEWDGGEIVLTGHRIGLYHVISDYKEGLSVEQLHEQFPTLPIELIHQVLAFYCQNQAETDAYVADEQAEIERLRATTPRVFNWEELHRRHEATKRKEAK